MPKDQPVRSRRRPIAPTTTSPSPAVDVTPPARSEKVSVSLPADLTSEVRTRVGSRGFSGYVARAVKRQIERDNLDTLLAEMEAVNGPVPDHLLLEVEALWPGAANRR